MCPAIIRGAFEKDLVAMVCHVMACDVGIRSLKSASAEKPRFVALVVSKFRGHPSTILIIASSGFCFIRATTLFPETFLKASICSSIVQDKPGIFKLLRSPNFSRLIELAWVRKWAADRGEACQ